MIDLKIMGIASTRIHIEIGEQQKRLLSEFDRIIREMRDRGVLQSGMTIKRVADLCVDTVKNRAKLVWQILLECITAADISYSPKLANELKAIVAKYLPEEFRDLNGYIKRTVALVGLSSPFGAPGVDLKGARNQALRKVGTEIDLFVLSLKSKVETEKDRSSSTVININSPVGSIQTGNGSTANVIQNIEPALKEQLLKALDKIISTLSQPELETHTPKGELIEVAQESQKELRKEKPTLTRLRSLLTTIGTSIQVISSLKPAYDTLKHFLKLIGIPLP